MLPNLKRKSLEDDSIQTPAKRGTFQFFKWKLWVMTNYTFLEGEVTHQSDIIRDDRKENVSAEPLTPRSLGFIIREVFGSMVKSVSRGPKGNRHLAFENLGRIGQESASSNSLYDLKLPDNWSTLNDRSGQTSFIRIEHWEFNKARGTTELSVATADTSDHTLEVKCHGCSIDLKKDLDLAGFFANLPVQEQIHKAVQFIEGSPMCLGFKISANEDVATILPYVSGAFSQLKNGKEEEERRMFSSKCLLFTTPASSCCSNCASLLHVNNLRKRRKAKQVSINPTCNKRFMSKEEIEAQLMVEQRAKRNAEKRALYWKEREEQASGSH